jgi:cell division protein FtsW (lipid II flippase)
MKQALWTCISLATMLYAFTIIDLKKLRRLVPFLTVINIILMILVLFFGREIKGATRSFSFMGVNFQPSLFVRIMLVLYFAHYLDKKQESIPDSFPKGFVKNFKPLIVLSLISFAVILKQQHFSTIIISSATLFSLLWISRIRLLTMMLIILIILIGGAGILTYGASYRSSRMEIYSRYSLFHKLMNKDVSHITADDYQIKQSLTSLSQGGLWGTSSVFGQAKNYYLPEPTTDYIYSVIGEEFGFIGAIIIFSLYCVILFRGLFKSWRVNNLYLKLAGIGLTLNIFFNAFVNIGVAISALPSTGVTLPFVSYGGTSLVANSLCIGLLLNITAERRAC